MPYPLMERGPREADVFQIQMSYTENPGNPCLLLWRSDEQVSTEVLSLCTRGC